MKIRPPNSSYICYNCRSEGEITMETCPSYGVNTTKPTVQDQVYEECDTKAHEQLYN